MIATTPYASLVAAASQLTDTDALVNFDGGNTLAAAAILERNHTSLRAARSALGPECKVPLRFEEAFFEEHRTGFSHLRNLACAFRAEARLAASKDDYCTAAKAGIDILELANSVRRGGLVVDALVSIAFAGIGIEVLRANRAKFDGATRQYLIRQLCRLDEDREPFHEIAARDQEWEEAVGYNHEPCDWNSVELMDPDECGMSHDEQRDIHKLIQQYSELPDSYRRKMECDRDQGDVALMRLLAVDLALREWHSESGSFPSDLTGLTPRLLPKSLLEPYTEKPFIYRRDGDLFHLYSTGPKSHDGGGQIGSWPMVLMGCADLCLDFNDHCMDCCTVKSPQGFLARMANSIREWWRGLLPRIK